MTPDSGGKLVVLTAPLSEAVDGQNFVLQMSMASMPKWMEFVLNLKYPNWHRVDRRADGSAACMPAGLRVVERALIREFGADEVVACHAGDLGRFIGPRTRVVGVSTHNPLGVTFAAGIFASVFGSSREPITSHYTKQLFASLRANPFRSSFKVIVGGTGGWQIVQTGAADELGVDCVVEGRGETPEAAALFRRAVEGGALPRSVSLPHPKSRDEILMPDRRTTFGAIEMTTGCGRRCSFCAPDLNPQVDLPKEQIMEAVRAHVRDGGTRVSLATEDTFIWGQVGTGTPFFFPNRERLVDLCADIAGTPGVETLVLTHCTLAPFVVDPSLIAQLSDILLPMSPYHLPRSRHPQKKVVIPLIGLETGSVRTAARIMAGKALPFAIEDWPSLVLEALRIANANHWYPMLTLMVGSPEETDEDVRATLDLVYEMERRGLFAFLIPSIFTPLPDTRMAHQRGVTESRELTPLQWQLILKCWKSNLQPGQYISWVPSAWRLGALVLWATRLRRLNGPNSTWPLMMFSGLFPEQLLARYGKIHVGKLGATKSRRELIEGVRPHFRRFFPPDDDGPGGPESEAADPSEVAGPGTLMPAVDAIRSTA
jgi:radical SAM superfamily enzyme YgiQ (UPF0313 family)